MKAPLPNTSTTKDSVWLRNQTPGRVFEKRDETKFLQTLWKVFDRETKQKTDLIFENAWSLCQNTSRLWFSFPSS